MRGIILVAMMMFDIPTKTPPMMTMLMNSITSRIRTIGTPVLGSPYATSAYG